MKRRRTLLAIEPKRIRYSEPIRYIVIPEICMVHTKKSLIKTKPQDFSNDLPKSNEIIEGLDKELEEIESKIGCYKKRLGDIERLEIELGKVEKAKCEEAEINAKIEKEVKKSNENIGAYINSIGKIKEEIIAGNQGIKEKKAKLEELKKKSSELLDEYDKCMKEEQSIRKEDFWTEYLIHRMRGKLYTILIQNTQISNIEYWKSTTLQIKSTNKWNYMQFDTIIDKQLNLCDNFDYIRYWFELTINVIQFFIRSDYKNLTYLIFSVKQQFKLPALYIEMVLSRALCNKHVTIQGHELDTKTPHKKLNSSKEIEDYIQSTKEKSIEITIRTFNKVITFILINAENPSSILKAIKEQKRSKDSCELNTIFSSIQIGYLILIIDLKETEAEDIEKINKVFERINELKEILIINKN